VYRDSSIWAVHDIASGTGNKYSSLHYIRLNPFTDSLLEDVVYGRDSTWYILPAVTVNQDRSVFFTYSRSSSREYIGAYVASRREIDPPGLCEVIMKPGESTFSRVPAMRWGDYNGIALDPDAATVWAAGEYAASPSGTWGMWVGAVRFPPTAVDLSELGRPGGFRLEQNYPNPFNPSTTIRYGLPGRSHVTISVFNTLGQQVAILQDGEQEAGYHEVTFDAGGLASGAYLYRLQAGDVVLSKKLILLR
jgi:hypothetical protein